MKSNNDSVDVIDQMGRTVSIPIKAHRIISLVPSQTELLFYLGLREKVVGVTKFCIHPSTDLKNTPKIGGTKKFNFARVDALNPDLIIGNKEENYKEGVEQLAKKYPVWMSDINDLEMALDMIHKLGAILDKAETSQKLCRNIRTAFAGLTPSRPLRVLYLIWRAPYMGAGNDTFIHSLLQLLGWANVLENHPRYPELGMEEIARLEPDLILLSSEPYPFQQKHIEELNITVPDIKCILVNGEFFSWYGSRLRYAPTYFSTLLEQVSIP